MRAMRVKGMHTEADRLLQAGGAGYPGFEEMEVFAGVLGGGIEVVPLLSHDRALQVPGGW